MGDFQVATTGGIWVAAGARNRPLRDVDRRKNTTKSRVRAKAEHPFLILKRIFGFNKVRYRGLDKNANRLFMACGLVNLYLARRKLLRPNLGNVRPKFESG